MDSKIIAFSLWGNTPKYCVGAIKNAVLAQKWFPEWKCHFYCGSDVPDSYIQELSAISNVQIFRDVREWEHGAFWRFQSGAISDDTISLFRDTDSRLSERERKCVDGWLYGDKKYLVIRDHPRHFDFPILAGMWGVKGKIDKFATRFKYNQRKEYLWDQIWLQQEIWPVIQDRVCIYQLYHQDWFSIERDQDEVHFIGQSYNENDIPQYSGWDSK